METKEKTSRKHRPIKLHGSTYKVKSPVGSVFITINSNDNNEPLEVFVYIGKAGSDITAISEGMGRLINLILTMNGDITAQEKIELIIKHLKGIGGARSMGFGDEKVCSLPDAIAKTLEKHFKLKVKADSSDAPVDSSKVVASTLELSSS